MNALQPAHLIVVGAAILAIALILAVLATALTMLVKRWWNQ